MELTVTEGQVALDIDTQTMELAWKLLHPDITLEQFQFCVTAGPERASTFQSYKAERLVVQLLYALAAVRQEVVTGLVASKPLTPSRRQIGPQLERFRQLLGRVDATVDLVFKLLRLQAKFSAPTGE